MHKKRVAIYCGASVGNQSIYEEQTKKIGQWLVENDYELVYGGGHAGLMGIIADTVLENKGIVIGVMPTFLFERELAHSELTKMYVVDDMHERKRKMIDLSDCYIALPGGPGTLEEISEVISWGRVGEHQNPCICFNSNGYYDLLEAFFDKMVLDNFLTTEDREKILFSDDLTAINQFIQTYSPPKIRTYDSNKK